MDKVSASSRQALMAKLRVLLQVAVTLPAGPHPHPKNGAARVRAELLFDEPDFDRVLPVMQLHFPVHRLVNVRVAWR
jgi:hypothetical protein